MQIVDSNVEKRSNLNKADIYKIRDDFPILSREVFGNPLVYLDNAATTQKPQCVIDKITKMYCLENANVHRGGAFS